MNLLERLIERLSVDLPHEELSAWLGPALERVDPATDPARLASFLEPHLVAPIASLDATGLLLAAAALSGDLAALMRLEGLLVTEVRRAVAPIDRSLDFIDEVTQLVRERLLVEPARLADYAGQGPLEAWVRAVSVRVALNARRPGAREDLVSSVPEQQLLEPNPELALLRARHHEAFKTAFAAAVASLSARDRTILRLTTLDGLTLAQVGTMYGKDASTISRWLATSRQQLLDQTRGALSEQLGVTGSALDSVMRAADSELNLSISRLLESRSPP
jgi:RNA polymerase sigma-70 factor (ECF subfamily)